MAIYVQKLCNRARRGDKNATSELLKMFYERIFSYLRRLSGSDQDAEDLTQKTFIKVWTSLPNYRGRCNFSTWSHRIAYHVYIDWRRQKTHTQFYSDRWWEACMDHRPGPFDSAAQRETAKHLYEAVDRLDEGKKDAVHLHYYQRLSLRETAQVLNISTSTVKYRLREALKYLRSEFACMEN